MPRTPEVAAGIVAIDTMMAGRELVTSAYLIRADEPTLIETGPTSSLDAVLAGLDSLGVGALDLAHVVVTHIHLDHAGGMGSLASSFPYATLWAHHRGAPHLADPTKLVQSVARVYGEERMRQLFGPVEPVPAERLRALGNGDRLRLGTRTLDVIYTPGHASHHVALVDSDTGAVFTGDALGIHLPDVGVLRPATPPPDIDVEASLESIGRIRDLAKSVLLFSHYGPVRQVDELCEIASKRLRTWAGVVREAMDETDDLDRIAQILDRRTASEFEGSPARPASTEARDRYEILASMRINAAGLVRYWRKRAEREELERTEAPRDGDRSPAPEADPTLPHA